MRAYRKVAELMLTQVAGAVTSRRGHHLAHVWAINLFPVGLYPRLASPFVLSVRVAVEAILHTVQAGLLRTQTLSSTDLRSFMPTIEAARCCCKVPHL